MPAFAKSTRGKETEQCVGTLGLQAISKETLPESQSGFCAGRSTSDKIFTLRQLQEKAVERHRPLYVVFVDFTKAFDTVDRATLWKVLDIYGGENKDESLLSPSPPMSIVWNRVHHPL